MKHLFLAFVLLVSLGCFGQVINGIQGQPAYINEVPMAVGAHCSTDQFIVSANSITCHLTPNVTAHSAINCNITYPYTAFDLLQNFQMTDNVNTGRKYQFSVVPHTDTVNYYSGKMYLENALAGDTTVTFQWNTAKVGSRISCEEVKNTRYPFALDGNFPQSSTGTGTPNTGTAKTPLQSNEFVIATATRTSSTTQSPTAAAPFTGIDVIAPTGTNLSGQWPEYAIQGVATATNGSWTSGSFNYYADMAAFSLLPGTCDSSMIVDWGKAMAAQSGSVGDIPTVAGLNGGTFGWTPQPNANLVTHAPQWTIDNGGTMLAYNNTVPVQGVSGGSNMPWQTSETCPTYSGNGATSGVGLQFTANGSTTDTGLSLDFGSSVDTISLAMPVILDLAGNTPCIPQCGGVDMIVVAGASTDFISMGPISDGTHAGFNFETGCGEINGLTGNFTNSAVPCQAGSSQTGSQQANSQFFPNHKYWFWEQFNNDGSHYGKIFDGCPVAGATPLLYFITPKASLNGHATGYPFRIQFGGTSWHLPTGVHIWMGPMKIDTLYGGALWCQ